VCVRWHELGDVFDRGDCFVAPLLAMTPETCHCEQSEAISPVENTRPFLRHRTRRGCSLPSLHGACPFLVPYHITARSKKCHDHVLFLGGGIPVRQNGAWIM